MTWLMLNSRWSVTAMTAGCFWWCMLVIFEGAFSSSFRGLFRHSPCCDKAIIQVSSCLTTQKFNHALRISKHVVIRCHEMSQDVTRCQKPSAFVSPKRTPSWVTGEGHLARMAPSMPPGRCCWASGSSLRFGERNDACRCGDKPMRKNNIYANAYTYII